MDITTDIPFDQVALDRNDVLFMDVMFDSWLDILVRAAGNQDMAIHRIVSEILKTGK